MSRRTVVSEARRRASCFVQPVLGTRERWSTAPVDASSATADAPSGVDVGADRWRAFDHGDLERGQAMTLANEGQAKRASAKRERAMTRVAGGWRERVERIKQRTSAALESGHVSIWMANITAWALFGDDLRLLTTNANADLGFLVLVYVSLVSFGIELILSVFAVDGFLGSFYFWLDLVATTSLLADIPAFMRAIGMDPCQGVHSNGSNFDSISNGGGDSGGPDGGFAKAGRASRAATRAGRIVRIIRLIRLVKIFKTIEMTRRRTERLASLAWSSAKRNSMTKQVDLILAGTAYEHKAEDEDSLLDFEEPESRVGQKLSDLTTKRVILGILLTLVVLPLFDVRMYPVGTRTELAIGGLEMVHETMINTVGEQQGFYQAVDRYYDQTDGMYRLVVNGTNYAQNTDLSFTLDDRSHKELRCTEFEFTTYSGSSGQDALSFVFFDRQHESRIQALLSVLRTIFVCVILIVGAVLFSKDTNALVLRPLDRMIDKIRTMSENPLTKFQIDGEDDGEEQMETRLLENSISRICSLLAVGFGDAGSEIIAENMKRGGAIDPMIPGKKVIAIFGFCDIRQFTDTTEVLQEDIMEFVNTIAKIVHMEVHVHGGSANKNIGDAFLLVWKFPKDITGDDIENMETLGAEKRRRIQIIADNALASFVTIIGSLRRSARLNRYRDNQGLNERIKGFDVKMGFGLHVGWAIEGAIGSEHKVDASYLSPNVNVSARLEAATKQFGVPLLFTGEFADLLSQHIREESRQIDCVTVKGSINPVKLYTFDVQPENIATPDEKVNYERTFEEETLSLYEYTDEFNEHPDILKMREGVKQSFLFDFKRGVESYIAGDWTLATEILQTTRMYINAKGDTVMDGPSESLLAVMKIHGGTAPKDWSGFRELTEK